MEKCKCVILCGGQSLRTRFELPNIPKTLALVEEKPLLHHIISYYHSKGIFNEIILCLGNDGDLIKQSFSIENSQIDSIVWKGLKIKFLETGKDSTSTSRVLKAAKTIDDEFFFLSYADVIGNFDLMAMLELHKQHNAHITMALAKTQMPYGYVEVKENDEITNFIEKPISNFWINAGVFVINKRALNVAQPEQELENEFLPLAIQQNLKLLGYKHTGYWKGVDTYKDLIHIRDEWTIIKKILKVI